MQTGITVIGSPSGEVICLSKRDVVGINSVQSAVIFPLFLFDITTTVCDLLQICRYIKTIAVSLEITYLDLNFFAVSHTSGMKPSYLCAFTAQ